jgi:hypothetical protein
MEFYGAGDGTKGALKTFGGASLHPRRFLSNARKMLTSFSWLSFSLPFYSPPNFLKFPASVAGGARIQSSCIDSSNYLVKRKVIGEREKVKMRKLCRRLRVRSRREFAEDGEHREAVGTHDWGQPGEEFPGLQ